MIVILIVIIIFKIVITVIIEFIHNINIIISSDIELINIVNDESLPRFIKNYWNYYQCIKK